jgi:hypothetical protein
MELRASVSVLDLVLRPQELALRPPYSLVCEYHLVQACQQLHSVDPEVARASMLAIVDIQD